MALNPADIAIVSRLLDQVLGLPAGEREAWLVALPAGHKQHATAIRDMLAQEAKQETADFLLTLPILGDEQKADETLARAGDLIGPYRLLHEIGRGGMGSVWLAERADGNFKRQVALKLPRLAWGAGLVERMARERDIGARLEHPAIARLYDAGVDGRGRPYLALEFIDGKPIDAWCEAQGLSVQERLRLFVQVARAVAYAHGRLVVHRDLKPSNVLVKSDGHAHLLDFGIAKLLQDVAPGEPGLTQDHGRVLTPHYASPEQVAGEAITVQSDVYSLGALLYQLLTGTLPIAPKRSSLGAVEDAILEGAAPLASSRVKDRVKARALRGEVDAILTKSMQREPGRRYATADALVLDIERHLNGETIAARQDSVGYRLQKTVRRHWLGFGAGAVVIVAVAGGGAAAAVQAQRANAAAQRATQAATQARVVKDFVVDIFKLNSPGGGGDNEARQLPVELLLDRGARMIEQKFAGQQELQVELLGVVTRIMLDMNAQQLALQYASKHVAALKAAGATPDERSRGATLLVEALMANEIPREAGLIAREALASARDAGVRTELHLQLFDVVLQKEDFAEAGQELAAARNEVKRGPEGSLKLIALADYAQARLLTHMNEFEQAKPLFERAISGALAAQGSASRLASKFRIGYAMRLTRLGHTGEAKAIYKQAFDAMRASGGPDDIEAALAEADAISRLAETQQGATGYKEAEDVFARTLATLAKHGDRMSPRVRAHVEATQACVELFFGQAEKGYALAVSSAQVLSGTVAGYAGGCLSWAQMMTGRHAEAAAGFQASHACEADCLAHEYVAAAHNRIMQRQFREARKLLESVPALVRLNGATPVLATQPQLRVLLARARLELEEGHYAAVEPLLAGVPDGRYMMNDSVELRSEAACRLGQAKDVVAAMRARVATQEEEKVVGSPWLADSRARLGLCELMAGKRAQAERMAELARKAFEIQPGVSPAYKRVLRELDNRLSQRGE